MAGIPEQLGMGAVLPLLCICVPRAAARLQAGAVGAHLLAFQIGAPACMRVSTCGRHPQAAGQPPAGVLTFPFTIYFDGMVNVVGFSKQGQADQGASSA